MARTKNSIPGPSTDIRNAKLIAHFDRRVEEIASILDLEAMLEVQSVHKRVIRVFPRIVLVISKIRYLAEVV